MGVGGLRCSAVSLAALLPIAPAGAQDEPAAAVEPSSGTAPTPAASLGNEPEPAASAERWALPKDAARRYSPFLNGTWGRLSVGERFDSDNYFGSELGGFLGPWRVSLRALFPFGVDQTTGSTLSNPDFQSIASTVPALIWGASLGLALYSSRGFVSSFGVNFMRTDVSDFGNMLGVSLPLEWVTRRGIRIGVEPGFLGAFGGQVLGECRPDDSFEPTRPRRDCDEGEIRAFDRESDTGLWIHVLVGIPFEAPEPEPVFGD